MEPWSQQEKAHIFAAIFDAVIKRLGETQQSLGRAIGVDQGTLSRWKNLRVRPRRLEFRDLLHSTFALGYEQVDAMLWLAGHRPLDQWEARDHFGESVTHRRKTPEELQAEAARLLDTLMKELNLAPDEASAAVHRALLNAGVEAPQEVQGEAASSGERAAGLAIPQQFQALIQDKTAGFVGREYVFEAVASFLSDQPNGYFVIEGDPGVGKSAILAEYVRRTGCVAHINIRAQGINRADQFLSSVATQLVHRYRLPYPALPPDTTRDGAVLARLLEEASMRLRPGERLVIAVDALDEVEPGSQQLGPNILYLPASLPRGVYFLLTRRPASLPLAVSAPYQALDLMEYRSQGLEDVQTHIRQAAHRPQLKAWIDAQGLGVEAFVAMLGQKSENNFMYLRYVLADIERGVYRDLDLVDLPRGLEGYYEDHWRRMGMAATPLPKVKIKLVYILAEVRQPVPRRLIAEFASEDQLTVQEVLDQWEQFLHRQRLDEETRYSLYHASFRDFLHRRDIVQAAGVSVQEINALIAENLWQELFRNE